MKTNALIGLLGVVGLAVLGCSGAPAASCGDACPGGGGEAGDDAGERDPESAGAGGDAHLGAGDGVAGAPAVAGGAGGEAPAGNAGAAGAEAEPSPWIVYVADEETPGKHELYAVRVADLGQEKRVKLSPDEDFVALPIAMGAHWSPDGKAYAFQNLEGDELYVVRFNAATIEGPFLVHSGEHGVEWSPSSNALLVSADGGAIVYERQTDGTYAAQPLSNNGYGSGWGEWKDDDEIVHLVIDPGTDTRTLWLSHREGESWTATPLVNGPGLSFELSPDGQYVSYTVAASGSGALRNLYVSATAAGSTGKKLAGPGKPELRWSPTGARFLLSNAGDHSWGGRSALTSGLSTPIGNASFETATFAPDGTRLQFWQQIDTSYARLGFYDLTTTSETLHDEVVASNDRSLEWSLDGSSYLVASQPAADAEVALVLGDPTNPANARVIDTVPSGDRFPFFRFSDSAEFLVYDRLHGDSWETLYVDLRGVSVSQRQPVKVPGEGLTWSFEFEPGGSNATYTMRHENGAQPCFFLDLSRQVAKEPVQVSGEGRVEYCVLQPRAK